MRFPSPRRPSRLAMRFAMVTLPAALILPPPTIAAQSTVPIRPLGPTVATSAITFGAVTHLRVLSDGRVLVDDTRGKKVFLLDAQLAKPTIVLDSLPGQPNSYGTRNGALVGFVGDTTIFIDATTSNFIYLDPSGRIVRQTALPTGAATSNYLTSSTLYGLPGVDARRRLIYRVPAPRPPLPPPGSGSPLFLPAVDSALLVAFDFQTRVIDTIGAVKIAIGVPSAPTPALGSAVALAAASAPPPPPPNIFPTVDDWTVTPDGAVAMLRGRDYHVDWVEIGGAHASTPKLPYDWKRLTDADKARLADSMTARRDSMAKVMAASAPAGATPILDMYGAAVGFVFRGGAPGSELPPPSPSAPLSLPVGRPYTADNVPEYLPPFDRTGAMLADDDGHLWIHTARQGGEGGTGGSVFDVVNRAGTLVDRVRISEGRTLVGLGPGGAVYLISHDAGVERLEKALYK